MEGYFEILSCQYYFFIFSPLSKLNLKKKKSSFTFLMSQHVVYQSLRDFCSCDEIIFNIFCRLLLLLWISNFLYEYFDKKIRIICLVTNVNKESNNNAALFFLTSLKFINSSIMKIKQCYILVMKIKLCCIFSQIQTENSCLEIYFKNMTVQKTAKLIEFVLC